MKYEIAIGKHHGAGITVLNLNPDNPLSESTEPLISNSLFVYALVYMAEDGWDFKGKFDDRYIWQREAKD